MPIEVGVEAPDFTLKDQNNQEVRLSSFRGERNVLLVFYPLAFTGTCQGELCSVRDNLNDFVNDEVQVLTVSVDSSPTHKVWAEREGYQFPLLADFWPHGAVAQAYGVFNDERGLRQPGHVRHRQGRHRPLRRGVPARPGPRPGRLAQGPRRRIARPPPPPAPRARFVRRSWHSVAVLGTTEGQGLRPIPARR